ncbi:MAG: iron-containing redox enzyme family protein [Alphaproteobacteria bacterium]|nr:iron-containing redox enzyme family protein [Alphaproteobacteria bacterium]
MKVLSNIKYFPEKLPSLEILIRRNKKYKDHFKKNLLFNLMDSGYFNTKRKRDIFLEYFQVWSNYFQKTMLLKTALCDDPNFTPIFNQHFTEEFGHDQMLNSERPKINVKKDPVLEALCNWFLSKMLSLSPHEQVVVMNLCVEATAVIFYSYAIPAIDPHHQLEHFKAHESVDIEHENMGLSLLEDLPVSQYERLLGIQEDSWGIFEALMNRIAELVQEKSPHTV